MPRIVRADTNSSAQEAALVALSDGAKMPPGVWLTRSPPYLASSVSGDLVVQVQLMTPVLISRCAELLGRTDDVGEQHRGEPAFGRCQWGPFTELEDFRRDHIDYAKTMVLARRQR